MTCRRATRGANKRYINYLLAHPATVRARRSKVLRRHLDAHGYVTPNFSWEEMDDSQGPAIPRNLRQNTIRHAWNLERFSRALGKRTPRGRKLHRVAISVDGPYRTIPHNIQVGGATNSRHTYADASDHFKEQVARWRRETGLSEQQIIRIAERHFTAIGNETSGTLHFDSRPGKRGSVSFVTW
jgi:hypothetical protein